MHRINLIKDSARFSDLKSRVALTRSILLGIVFLSALVYASLLGTTFYIQSQLSQLQNQTAQQATAKLSGAAEIGKTLYATDKLKAIREIYVGSPEYYKQYQYLLNKIVDIENFNIEDLALDNKDNVVLVISSDNLEDTLNFLAEFDKPEVKQNFAYVEISGFSALNEEDRETASVSASYRVSLKLQFDPKFNESTI